MSLNNANVFLYKVSKPTIEHSADNILKIAFQSIMKKKTKPETCHGKL